MNAAQPCKCACPACQGHVEYPLERAEQPTTCPHCHEQFVLPTPNRKPAKVPRGVLYCPNCGTWDRPRLVTKGSFAVELALWLLFCAPGLIYSLWRVTCRQKVCRVCGNPNVMPASAPRAQELLRG